MSDFDTFMTNLPFLVLVTAVSMGLSWVVIRSAVLSALRKHAGERQVARDDNRT